MENSGLNYMINSSFTVIWYIFSRTFFTVSNRGIANHTDNNTPYDACSDFDGPVVSQEEVSINNLMIIWWKTILITDTWVYKKM